MSKPIATGSAPAQPSADTITIDSGSYPSPSHKTLLHAVKLSIVEDKPIMMDYWVGSLDKSVLIGVREGASKEKILVRNEEEYTSPIAKIFSVDTEYIIMTENSIYIVDAKIPKKYISE
jgi:hypothetical protein